MTEPFVIENKLNPSSIAILLFTYYPKWYRGKLRSVKHSDKIRGDIALETVNKAKELGYKVFVADANSRHTFRRILSGIEGIKLIKRRSPAFSSNKQRIIKSISKTLGIEIIVMTEPEKLSLVEECIPAITNPIFENKADIVIPKRDDELFKKTYPAYQYDSEVEANMFYNETLKANGLLSYEEELDTFFGPRAFRNERKILSLFTRGYKFNLKKSILSHYFNPGAYSETLFFPVVLALKRKIKVISVTIPFSYPKTQKENEEKLAKDFFIGKRKAQKINILIELIHFLSYLDKNPASRLKLLRK